MNISQQQHSADLAGLHLDHVIKIICGHEFNTPMTTILGVAEMLQEDKNDLTSKEKGEYLSFISLSGYRLNNLSKRLGIWYVLSKGRFIQKKTFDIHIAEFVQIVDDQRELFKDKNPEKIVNISSNTESITLEGDRAYLLHAFKELINNAFKFTLLNTIVNIIFTAYNNELVIRITNLSEMVSGYQLKEYQVFTQFNRHKFEQQGLGVGLEIAKLGIEQCGGRFSILGKDIGGICELEASIVLPIPVNGAL